MKHHITILPYPAKNQIMLDLEVKDYARRLKVAHPELTVDPSIVYFMISHDNNEKALISTCR